MSLHAVSTLSGLALKEKPELIETILKLVEFIEIANELNSEKAEKIELLEKKVARLESLAAIYEAKFGKLKLIP